MADAEQQKRDRSPNYPFINLATAIDRAKALYFAEKRGAVAMPVLAKHWDYSEKSSGLVQTTAALKSYGLLDDAGRGDARRVRLTDRALRILLDERPDSSEKMEHIRQAAVSPPLMAKVLEQFPTELPSSATLNHFLVFDLKFGSAAAKAAQKIIEDNQLFIDLYTHTPLSDTITEMEEAIRPATATSFPAPKFGAQKSEKIIGPDGDIVLQFSQDPSWESYDFLENYIKLRKTVLKRGGANGEEKK